METNMFTMEPFTTSQDCSIVNKQCSNEAAHDDFHIVLSYENKQIFELVTDAIFCGLVSLFGIVANIINMYIFYKHGFTNTVNIAFFGLAISDLCCVIAMGWSSICINPFLPVYDVMWVSVEVMYLSGSWPNVCFCRITSYITVYITAERFISIAWPLKVKQIVTARRTTTIISLIYIANIMTLIPEYATTYLGPRFVPEHNKTLIGVLFTNSRGEVEGAGFVIHSLFSASSFIAVVIFTFALVLKLQATSQWRKGATSNQLKDASSENKERKTMKMVVLIASVLIICYTPGAIIAMAMFIVGPEFNIRGRFANICVAVWSVANLFQTINSSINIFLYYKMSSKYRHTLNEIFLKMFSSTYYKD